MNRLARIVALGCSALLLAGSAGSAPGPGTLAFASGPYGNAHVYSVEADGTGLRNLTAAYAPGWFIGAPRWSPDGSKVVYSQYASETDSDIYVLDAAGNRRQLTNASGREDAPIWSPGGDQIAFVRCCPGGVSQLVVMGADGGNWRAIANQPNGGYDWSSRNEIAYTVRNVTPFEIHVVHPDGAGHRLLGQGAQPRWSPDGRRISFIVPGEGSRSRLLLANADGGGRREVSPRQVIENGSWSPDGRQIAFTPVVLETRRLFTHVYSVNVDSGQERRLAGGDFPTYHGAAWGPDGARVVIGIDNGLAVADSDGTCYLPLDLRVQALTPANWRPGTGGTRFACSHLALTGGVSKPAIKRRRGVTFRLNVTNHGAMPATDLRLVAKLTGSFKPVSIKQSHGACRMVGLTLECALGRLGVGETARVRAGIQAKKAGPLRAVTRVSANEVDPNPTDNTLQLVSRAYACSILGTEGQDRLRGGGRMDVLCALGGDDRIFAHDRRRDWISCGTGRDYVVADRVDRVGRDCERVRRR